MFDGGFLMRAEAPGKELRKFVVPIAVEGDTLDATFGKFLGESAEF